MVWGSIISAAGNILGGVLASRSQEDQADENLAAQREFAQQGIRWRVADAQAAGIHPLYALGAQIPTFSPSYGVGGDGLAAGLAGAGQDISRAIDATRTAEERADARFEALQLERGELENDLLRAQIAKLSQVGPPLPSAMDGVSRVHSGVGGRIPVYETQVLGGDTPRGYEVKPVEIPATAPGKVTQEAGALPGTRWERTKTGWRPHPSKELVEDADLFNIPAMEWYFRNRVIPTLSGTRYLLSGRRRKSDAYDPPPREWLPPGATGWKWSRPGQEYQPVFD